MWPHRQNLYFLKAISMSPWHKQSRKETLAALKYNHLTSQGAVTKVVGKPPPPLAKSLLSLMPLTPTCCDFRPMNAVTSRPPHPQGLVSTSSLFVWVRPSPTPYPLALTQAYYPLSAAWLNSDCWLVVEMEKEAFRVFIETHSFTRTITTLPHSKWKRDWETGRESKRETDKLIFGFTSHGK